MGNLLTRIRTALGDTVTRFQSWHRRTDLPDRLRATTHALYEGTSTVIDATVSDETQTALRSRARPTGAKLASLLTVGFLIELTVGIPLINGLGFVLLALCITAIDEGAVVWGTPISLYRNTILVLGTGFFVGAFDRYITAADLGVGFDLIFPWVTPQQATLLSITGTIILIAYDAADSTKQSTPQHSDERVPDTDSEFEDDRTGTTPSDGDGERDDTTSSEAHARRKKFERLYEQTRRK